MPLIPAKRLKYALFDLSVVVAVLVVATHLGGRAFRTAPPPAQRSASGSEDVAIGSRCITAEVVPATTPSARHRRDWHELRRFRVAVLDERKQLREELAAAPWSGDEEEEEIVRALTLALDGAETDLAEIELRECVLELERLSWPVRDGVTELRASLEGVGSLDGAVLVQRHMNASAALLNTFRAKVNDCRALDAALAKRGRDLEEEHRRTFRRADKLNGSLEQLLRGFEATRRTARSVRDTLIRLTDEPKVSSEDWSQAE